VLSLLVFSNNSWQETSAKDDNKPKGCYVAWLLSPRSAEEIASWANYMGIVDVVSPTEMHCSIMYAPDETLESDIHGDHLLPMPVEINHHNRPQTRILGKAGDAGALVTAYDSDLATRRHFQYRDMGLRPSFPTFIPHVTLSYDAHMQCPHVMKRLMQVPCELPVVFDRERVTYSK
jgi:hypothetical protein